MAIDESIRENEFSDRGQESGVQEQTFTAEEHAERLNKTRQKTKVDFKNAQEAYKKANPSTQNVPDGSTIIDNALKDLAGAYTGKEISGIKKAVFDVSRKVFKVDLYQRIIDSKIDAVEQEKCKLEGIVDTLEQRLSADDAKNPGLLRKIDAQEELVIRESEYYKTIEDSIGEYSSQRDQLLKDISAVKLNASLSVDERQNQTVQLRRTLRELDREIKSADREMPRRQHNIIMYEDDKNRTEEDVQVMDYHLNQMRDGISILHNEIQSARLYVSNANFMKQNVGQGLTIVSETMGDASVLRNGRVGYLGKLREAGKSNQALIDEHMKGASVRPATEFKEDNANRSADMARRAESIVNSYLN